MAHVTKISAGGMKGLSNHVERKTEKHKNDSIDPTKSWSNYALDNNENPMQYYQQRISEVRMNKKREDIKVGASWVITQPKDMKPDESRKFFETTHNFLSEKYGEKNIVWSRVHMDETTPHLHFCFIPVTPDKKHGGEKVCAKEVLTRKHLENFHGELTEALRVVFKRNVGVENGLTEKSLPMEKFKLQMSLNIEKQQEQAKIKELKNEFLIVEQSIGMMKHQFDVKKNELERIKTDTEIAQKNLVDIKEIKEKNKDLERSFVEATAQARKEMFSAEEKLKKVKSELAQTGEKIKPIIEAKTLLKNIQQDAKKVLLSAYEKVGVHKAAYDDVVEYLKAAGLKDDKIKSLSAELARAKEAESNSATAGSRLESERNMAQRECNDLRRENAELKEASRKDRSLLDAVKQVAPQVLEKAAELLRPRAARQAEKGNGLSR